MISIELADVLSVSRQIQGNDYDSGTHFFLGYLWAVTPEEEKIRIAKLFAYDLENMDKNK